MDNFTADEEMPRRRGGIIENIKGFVANALGATRDRVEDISAEVQHRTLKILFLVIWSVAGAVSLWLALCFGVLTIIFGFGLPPKWAFGIPALVFAAAALLSFVMFKRAKSSKRESSDYQDRNER
ncbi:MAG TPA: phage holin family protein [Candidatus Krumholzibacteria bacterium]